MGLSKRWNTLMPEVSPRTLEYKYANINRKGTDKWFFNKSKVHLRYLRLYCHHAVFSKTNMDTNYSVISLSTHKARPRDLNPKQMYKEHAHDVSFQMNTKEICIGASHFCERVPGVPAKVCLVYSLGLFFFVDTVLLCSASWRWIITSLARLTPPAMITLITLLIGVFLCCCMSRLPIYVHNGSLTFRTNFQMWNLCAAVPLRRLYQTPSCPWRRSLPYISMAHQV